MAKIIFVTAFFIVFFSYLGYPVSLFIIGLFRGRTIRGSAGTHSVKIIITVYNEVKRIRSKIENTLGFEYPKDKLRIIVVSDGSTDGTDKVVGEYEALGVEMIALPERIGKEAAQKIGIEHARGDLLIFTDAATILDPGSLKQIASNFNDPSIGCVSSEDRIIGEDGKLAGEGLYVRYEMWLRRLESKINSVVGLSGSFFAARREVCEAFSDDMQSDFRTVLETVRAGLRAISDPLVVGHYRNVADEKREFKRKVRTVLRGLTVFFAHIDFLNITKYGLFSYQLFCHKLLRWLVPFLLCLILMTNAILAYWDSLFSLIMAIQMIFYALGVCG
jgi:cellulose synthase/poly-beta-1,6-N-acetylglucosamine synthase-like glycosyltransferase